MKNKIVAIAAIVVGSLCATLTQAATGWSAQDYDLYAGDFDGDGKADVLYLAKDPSKPSGIARSDASGAPNAPWQSWPSNYLGIPWSGSQYTAHVADFNGDGKADILLQRNTPGDHYLLFADATGKIASIGQAISNSALGLTWSADQHRIIAADFSGDGKADLFFQATSASGTHAVVLPSGSGQFTSGPQQTWTDSSWSAFKWSTKNSVISAGDFNGDGRSDLLIQAKPNIVLIDYDIPIPVPTYQPNAFGVVYAQAGSTPFQQVGVQQWSRNANGVDWSPNAANVVVGAFNGDGRADVLLQARSSSRPSYLLTGNASGAAFGSGTAITANITISADGARLIAGNFNGSGGAGIYVQALTPAGTNYVANAVGASTSASVHNPTAATGVVPATAVGHTVGSFAVSSLGAATYSIPIVVPPGAAGMQPALSISYQSNGGNGSVGVGWGLGGLSEIERCKKTLVQDNSNDGVKLTSADRFCLDGNKLRLTSGSYGVAGSIYQTELETFSRVTAYGTAGNGPAYFKVEAKNGLTYEYGNSADSRIEAVNAPANSTTPHTWALNKISDRHGNTMTITYQEDGAPNGSYRPSQISYTSNSNAGLTAAYRVMFFWDSRPVADTLAGYLAGGLIKETKRLNRVETQYNEPGVGWRLVRKYQLSYSDSSSTGRSRLAAVQECDRDGSCLSPTMIGWQDSVTGWSTSDTAVSSASNALMNYAQSIDIDGDGRTDLVYPQPSGSATYWYFMRGNAAGGFDAPVATTINAGNSTNLQYASAMPFDYFAEGRMGLLVDVPGMSTRQILRWNGSTLALTNTTLSVALNGTHWIGDYDGDGRVDFMYSSSSGSTVTLYVHRNLGATSGTATFAAAQSFASMSAAAQVINPAVGGQASSLGRVFDFNGDGRTDVIYQYTAQDCESYYPAPICIFNTTFGLRFSTGTSFAAGPTWQCESVNVACPNPIAGDFNGDGLADLLLPTVTILGGYPNFTTSTSWQIAFGTGVGMSATSALNIPSGAAPTWLVADFDADGREDMLLAESTSASTYSLLRFDSANFEAPRPTSIPYVPSTSGAVRLVDADGDGQLDVGYSNAGYKIRKRLGGIPDLVNSITDGYGNNITVTYAPLTDTTFYTKGTGAQYPKMDVQASMYAVKAYSASDGVGGSYTITQKYAGLRLDLRGRGLLGFASRESVDGRTGIKSASSFLQDYPYIGFVSEASVYQSSSGPLISKTTNTPATLVLESTAYNDRKLPYASQAVQDSYEVGGPSNGQQITRATTTTALDSYANPISVTTTTLDMTGSNESYTTTTVNTYAAADTTNWCLDFVTNQTATNTVPGQAAQIRTAEYVKDTANLSKCRVYQEIVEPSDNAVKVTTTFGYNAFGHPTSQTVTAANIASRTATTSYGTQGVFPVSVTNQLSTGNQTAYKTYDYALGVPLTATDPNTLNASWAYDGFGRLLSETRPDGTKTAWIYSSCGIANNYCGDSRLRYQVQKQELDATTPGNLIRSSMQMFDSMGRSLFDQSQTLSGAFSAVRTHYDNQGRVYQRSQPFFVGAPVYYTTFAYDLLSRPITQTRQISEAVTGTQSTSYGYNRLIQTLTDANGKVTTKQFNAVGQVVRMTDAISGITQYQYDPFGNLKKTIDPANNEIVNTFNIRGFKTSTNDPDMGIWNYTYYPTGELWTQTDAKNQVVTFTYDELSRPKERNEAEGTTTFTYGTSAPARNIGKLYSVSSPGGYSETYAYDSLGRLQDATTNADATTFIVSNSYNSTSGFLETTTYPTSTSAVAGSRFKVKYEYANGLLKRTRDFNSPSTVYWEQVATDAAGAAIDEQFGNGLHTYSTYDAITSLLASRTSGATAQVQNLAYQWDKVGNLTQRKDNALSLTEDFYYDDLYRLDYSRLNGVTTPNLDVGYDELGNIKSKSDVGTYSYPASGPSSVRPHAVTSAGSNTYGYDANGNMDSRNGSPITWYSYNLPNRIDKGSNYSQFYYGAGRGRYKQVAYTAPGGSLPPGTETTIYIGGLFEKVTKPSGVIEYKHYIMAGKEAVAIRTLRSNSANDTRYLHKDHLGSVDTITNEAGAVVQRLSYDAFGKRRNAVGWAGALSSGDWSSIAAITHRGFTFHEQLDNVELIHMNGRVYDPEIGRFISADPFIQAPLMSQSLNRYSYVMNNPLSLVDPSGYSWLSKRLKSAWNSIRSNLNYIAAAVLVVVGAVATYFQLYPLAKAAFTAAAALVKSPVQLGYSRDGPYVVVGYGGFGVQSEPLGSGGAASQPPMTAPAGAMSLGSGYGQEWQALENAGWLLFRPNWAWLERGGVRVVDTEKQSTVFINASVRGARAREFQQAVHAYWGNVVRQSPDGRVYRLIVTLSVDQNAGLINVNPELGRPRSVADMDANVVKLAPRETARGLAHEFGHLLGFADFYRDVRLPDGRVESKAFRGFEDDLMGTGDKIKIEHLMMLADEYRK